jgi:hypothetical protein
MSNPSQAERFVSAIAQLGEVTLTTYQRLISEGKPPAVAKQIALAELKEAAGRFYRQVQRAGSRG